MPRQNESGVIIVTSPEGIVETSMRRCEHCGATWEHVEGSGKIRGWCDRCKGFFCGPGCEECVSIEQQLDNMEAGRPLLYQKVTTARIWMPGANSQ